jgi:hypothetical protein
MLDYILMSGLLSKIDDYNSSAITSVFLSSEVYSYFGLFYSLSLKLYEGAGPLVETESLLDNEISNLLGEVNHLQTTVGSNSNLKHAIDESMCKYLDGFFIDPETEYFNHCEFIQGN